MTPTLEQIEAAARTFSSSSWNTLSPEDQHRFREKAISALTAAAGVGPVRTGVVGMDPRIGARIKTNAAAAGVGETAKYQEQYLRDNDTIERCAQVGKAFIENLIDPKSATMSHWDQIREQCLNYKGSDLPRLNFESLIETIAEETLAAIRALKSDMEPRDKPTA